MDELSKNVKGRRRRMVERGLAGYTVIAHRDDIDVIREFAADLLKIRTDLGQDTADGRPISITISTER